MCDHRNSLTRLRNFDQCTAINLSAVLDRCTCSFPVHCPSLLSLAYKLIQSGLLLLAVVLFDPLAPALANTAGACGSDVTATPCSVNGASPEGSTPDPASSESVRQAPASAGNPINLITGNKYQKHVDYQSPASHLSWQRHYNSSNSAYDFGMGRGWAATFLASLQYRNRGGAALVQGNGRRINFREPTTVNDADGTDRLVWKAFAPSDGTLHIDGKYTLWSLPDGRQLKFKDQFLVNIDFPGPATLKIYYVDNRIDSVTDENSSQLRFDYYPDHATLPIYIEPNDETNPHDAIAINAAPARLRRLTLPNGLVIEYNYDLRGNLIRVRYPDSTERIYHYENTDYPSHLTGLIDRRGQPLATWDYNEEGYAILSEKADGVERVDLTFSQPTTIGGIGTTSVTNSLGEQSTYTWQRYPDAGHALILAATGASCATCPPTDYSYNYNDQFQLTDAKRGDGSGLRWEYDALGRTTASYRIGTDGSERLIREQVYEAHDIADVRSFSHRPIIIRYPSVSTNESERHEVLIDYNDDGLPNQLTERGFAPIVQATAVTSDSLQAYRPPAVVGYEPIERITSFSYDDGRLTSIDGPRTDVADTVTFGYGSADDDSDNNNAIGRLIEVRLPSGERIHLTRYNTDGQATEIKHNNSSLYQLTYDDNRRLITVSHQGNTQQYHYDAEGNTIGFTDAYGRHTRIDYDTAGRMNRLIDDIGQELHWVHNTESRRTEERILGFNGEEITNLKLFYDAFGQITSRTQELTNYSTGSLISQTTEFTHDATGRLIAAANTESARQLDYNWNPFGELLAVATPFTEVTDSGYNNIKSEASFTYDNKGRVTSVTDARENITTYLLDDFGRPVTEHNPDTGTTHFKHDSSDNIIARTTAGGDTTTYSHDAANRLLTQSSRDGTTRLTYHPTNGRLVATTNPVTSETFEYDNEGQITEHTREIDGRQFTTTYDYDERGRLSDKGLPNGALLRYHYHSSPGANAGQLRAITRGAWLGLIQETLIGEIDQDTRDGLTRHISHNGSVTEKRFHPNGSLQSINISNGLRLAYEFDDNGQISEIDKDGVLSKFNYLNGHLTRATTGQGNYSYRYDSLGNRTQKISRETSGKPENQNYRYPRLGQGNRLLAINESAYDYNTDGTPKQANRYRYEYNIDQRPIKVYEGDVLLAEYSYNSFGERIKKVLYTDNGTHVIYFLYDNHQLSTEIDAQEHTPIREQYRQTIYLGRAPVAYLQGSEIYTVQSDHLGTPHRVSDSNQETLWAANYTPFGEAIITTEHITFKHRFPGQYFDTETQTHYNYFRDYDPATGRYLTSDPIGLGGGLNTYMYSFADPVSLSDPWGLRVILIDRDLKGVPVGRHQFLVIIPDNPSDFEGRIFNLGNNIDFRLSDVGNGELGFVIGAQDQNDRLIAEAFNDADTTATTQFFNPESKPWYGWGNLSPNATACTIPQGASGLVDDTATINALLTNIANYNNNESRLKIPYPTVGQTVSTSFTASKGYVNSNSWALSVLDSLGIVPNKTNMPGADLMNANRIDPDYFAANPSLNDLTAENSDTDHDGILDAIDRDDDNDGVPDDQDNFIRDPNRQ